MSLFFFLISFCYFRSNGTDFGSKSIQTLNTVQDFYTFFRFYFKNFFYSAYTSPYPYSDCQYE